MPNAIKYKAGNLTGSLQKGNVALGVSGSLGPTSTTGWYNGPNVVAGKYQIFETAVSGDPDVFCPQDDNELIKFARWKGATGANTGSAAAVLAWIGTQSNLMASNFQYESIVTDGLVLNLDAGFVGSYPTTGTPWYDLSGNTNNGTLTNGPTFNSANSGSLVFDGVNDYATLGSSVPTTLRIGDGDFTIDFWVYTNGTATYAICGNLNDSNGDGSYWIILNSTFTGLHTVQFGRIGTSSKFGTTTLPINAWTNVILSRIGTTMICYINGATYSTPATVNNFAGNFNIDYLLGISKSNTSFSAYIYKGVGFTSTQVLQNYNAQKGRFGL